MVSVIYSYRTVVKPAHTKGAIGCHGLVFQLQCGEHVGLLWR